MKISLHIMHAIILVALMVAGEASNNWVHSAIHLLGWGINFLFMCSALVILLLVVSSKRSSIVRDKISTPLHSFLSFMLTIAWFVVVVLLTQSYYHQGWHILAITHIVAYVVLFCSFRVLVWRGNSSNDKVEV